MPVRTITFRKERLEIIIGEYRHGGRKSIELMTQKGEPFMVASVNLPEVDLEENEILIKNYSENEGIYEALVEAKVISPAKRILKSTFAEFQICKLLK